MKDFNFFMPNHNAYCITPIKDNAVRIRYNSSGLFKESLMERYDIVNTNFDLPKATMTYEDKKHIIKSGNLTVTVYDDAGLSVETNGITLIKKLVPFHPQDDEGIGGKITPQPNERYYGGGYRPNKSIELKGQIIKNWCAPVVNNGPSTFFMASGGWGIFWNNTCETFFDFGCKKEEELVFWSEDGEFDIFVFAGSFKEMISDFTDITGKPSLMPLNGYGITVVNNESENEISLIDKAERLRREKIPCDNFSISCEWMDTYYDKSVNQSFDTSRYFVHSWMGEHNTFIAALKHFGIKSTLWTPCDYDLTFEQERRYFKKHPEKIKPKRYSASVLKSDTSDMSIDANSKLFRDENLPPMIHHDPYTKPDEAWYEHFKRFFDLGIVGLAEDGHTVALTKPDHFYANGYSYKYMHNLNQTINSLQYYEGYKEYTGKRIFVRTPSTFIGHQKYCGTWCGDTTSDTSLIGLVQYSFQGQSNITADMISKNAEQIHSGMLMPWVLNFCWGQPVWPWMLKEDLKETYIYYATLRYALMPYIYTAARQAHKSGIPMCTAMIINYPGDERFYDCYNQYMFGESMLVGALSDTIHLPEGKWIDYWTGKKYDGMTTIKDGYPKDRGGYLFVKDGAIIPMWENVQYVGEKPIDSMTVEIFASDKGQYTLYEDDGISFEYENGSFALTKFSYEKTENNFTVSISESDGDYNGKPEKREYHLKIHIGKPKSIPDNAVYDENENVLCATIINSGNFEFEI